MRNLFLISITIFLNSAIAFGQYAEFNFDKKVIKLDAVQEGEVVETTFSFKNKGDEPLIITNYEVECSCTVVTFPESPVLPGEASQIEVRFDSAGKMGWQYRKILLYSNAKKNPFPIEFRLKVLNE